MAGEDNLRQVVLQMGVSIDGYVAGPPDESGMSTPVFAPSAAQTGTMANMWGLPPEDPELTSRKLAWLRDTGTHIMGSVTYQQMAAFWPTATDDYAAPMNEIPKVVFSKTLERGDWPKSRVARGDLADEIAGLKREPGGDIIAHGGARFVQSLARLGLIDEYRLTIHPIALGHGLPLFAELQTPLRLELVEATTYVGGTVVHVYRPA